ncbi:MAG TPA: hypothetical protein VMZ32_14985 [Gammaproteobacteria bacterium]|nr:hypothetical protein [Gammaproteobacteria bacterium]
MNKPNILDGITVAMVISLAAAAASLLLGGFIVYGLLFELLLYAATLAYLLYLLKRSRARIGRVLVIAAWAAICLGCWFFDVALLEQVMIQAGMIWLVRSLYFHGSLFSAVLDFGLVSTGLAASAWAMVNTGSLAAALWSFFLVQALFSWLPQLAREQTPTDLTGASDPSHFKSAHRVAEAAVRKLSQS